MSNPKTQAAAARIALKEKLSQEGTVEVDDEYIDALREAKRELVYLRQKKIDLTQMLRLERENSDRLKTKVRNLQIAVDLLEEKKKLSSKQIRLMDDDRSLDYILHWVCRIHGVTERELLMRTNKRKFTHARNAYFYYAKTMTGNSYPDIAKRLKKDHTTAISGCKRYGKKALRRRDREVVRKARAEEGHVWKYWFRKPARPEHDEI